LTGKTVSTEKNCYPKYPFHFFFSTQNEKAGPVSWTGLKESFSQ